MSILTATLSPMRVNAVLQGLAAGAPSELGVGDPAGAGHADPAARRPVHVVYGGAHLFKADTPAKLGRLALASFETWAKDAEVFAELMGLGAPNLARELAARVKSKLAEDAVEALTIDFEDGYGPRPDKVEDADAIRTAAALAELPPGPAVGMRIKPLSPATGARAVRTLDLFVTTLMRTRGAAELPRALTVTLPKVTRPAEVEALADLLRALEESLGLPTGAIGVELMIESPRALVDASGRVAIPALVAAAGGRCVAAHLGAYDLTAALGVTATDQTMDHPACDAARTIMQLALAGTSIAVFDSATTILPTGNDETAVHQAWKLHGTNVRRALAMGIYQGWDLHPAQLPARYGALYAFFLREREPMATRLATFVDKATQATRSGQVFDDAATGQGLLNFFLRGLACGALDAKDVTPTGLTLDELRSRSFARIVAARSRAAPSPPPPAPPAPPRSA